MIAFPKTVTVTWVDPNAAGLVATWLVKRNGTQVGTVPGGTQTYAEQVSAEGVYSYTVTAQNAVDTSVESSPAVADLVSLLPAESVAVVIS